MNATTLEQVEFYRECAPCEGCGSTECEHCGSAVRCDDCNGTGKRFARCPWPNAVMIPTSTGDDPRHSPARVVGVWALCAFDGCVSPLGVLHVPTRIRAAVRGREVPGEVLFERLVTRLPDFGADLELGGPIPPALAAQFKAVADELRGEHQ